MNKFHIIDRNVVSNFIVIDGETIINKNKINNIDIRDIMVKILVGRTEYKFDFINTEKAKEFFNQLRCVLGIGVKVSSQQFATMEDYNKSKE